MYYTYISCKAIDIFTVIIVNSTLIGKKARTVCICIVKLLQTNETNVANDVVFTDNVFQWSIRHLSPYKHKYYVR